VNSAAERTRSLEREWWLRAILVLQSPRSVFAALRDDSPEAALGRQEPVTVLMFLAGMAAVLPTRAARELLDNPDVDALVVPVWVVVAGAIYGLGAYWVGGAALAFAARRLGGGGSYRRARHLLAFAAAPIALSLIAVWPLRLSLDGGDLFRKGGSDTGTDGEIFAAVEGAFFLWGLGLLVVGIRVVYRWGWGRAIAAAGLAAVTLGAIVLLLALLGA
jgi:hypothetical protein